MPFAPQPNGRRVGLRVLFVTSWYPDAGHPMAGSFVREHARAVSRRAFVTVLHIAGPGEDKTGPVLVEDEGEEEAWAIPTFRLRYPRPGRGLGHLAATAWGLWAAERVWALRGPFDLVHGHIFRAGLVASLFGSCHGLPTLVTEHSSDVARGRLRPIDQVIAGTVYRSVGMVCPVSADLGKSIGQMAPDTPIRVVGNAVDLERFHPPNTAGQGGDETRLLFVGRLDEVKGLDVLFDALALLERAGGSPGRWALDLVGGGPWRNDLETQALDSGIGDKIRFWGYMPPESVARMMRQADLMVLPSRWENMPCVLLEALASGLPVVASRVGGIPEVLGPDRGILVRPGDSRDLARALSEALSDSRRFDRNLIARWARRFGLDAVGDRFVDLYHGILYGESNARMLRGFGEK